LPGTISHAKLKVSAEGTKGVANQLDQVGKATERVGRAQTRLGQASAASGRQFAAQASGLGGLVAAYAGAAATVFALTAAFGALNRAARSEQIIAGTNALAASLGLQGESILKNIQKITKGQLTLVESAEAANIALSAGLGADQIAGLTKVAFKASRALGRSLTDSFTRLTRGVAKLEPELLDELGIFTRIEPAAEAYAKTIGKTAAQLTNFEKRQAFANEALKEGTSKFKDIDTESATAAEALEKLSANIQDIGTNIGLIIAKFITPLVEIFGSGLPAAFLAASTARLIFGKTIDTLQDSMGGLQKKIEGSSEALTKKLSTAARVGKKELAGLSTETSKLTLNQTKGTTENRAAFNSLVKLSRAQKLTRDQAALLNVETERQIRLDAVRISVLRKKGTLTAKENTDLARLIAREKQLNAVRTQGIAVQNAQNAAIVRFGKVVAGSGKVLVGIGRGVLGLVNLAATITTIVAIFGTLITTALDFLGLLDPLTKNLKAFFDEFRRAIGMSPDDILAKDTVKAIASRLDTGLTTEFSATNEAIRKIFEAGGYRSVEGFTAALAEEMNTSEDRITAAVGDIINRIVEQFEFLTKSRQVLIGTLSEGLGQDSGAIAQQLDITEKGLRFSAASALTFNNALVEAGNTSTRVGRVTQAASLAVLGSQIAQVKLQEALNAGGARNETLDKLRAASKNRIIELEDVLATAVNNNQAKQIAGQLALAKLEDAGLSRRQMAQAALNQNADAIRKQFAAQITAFSKINGLLTLQTDGTVKLTRSSKEQRATQTAQLSEAFAAGKDALALQRAGIPLRGINVNLADRAAVAEKAIVGQFVKAAEELKKINEELEKRNLKLEESIKKTEKEASLLESTRDLRINKEGLDNIKRIVRLEKEQFDRAQRRIELERTAQKETRDRVRELAKFQTDQMGIFLDRDADRALEIKFASEDIDILAKQIDEDIKAMGEFAKERRLNTQVENSILEDQKRIAKDRNTKELELANIQKDAQIASLRLEEEKIKSNLDLIEIEAKAFINHVDGIANVLAADLSARQLLAEGTGFQRATQNRALDATLSDRQKGDINSLLKGGGFDEIGIGEGKFNQNLVNRVGLEAMPGEMIRAINTIINQTDVAGQIGEAITKPLAAAREGTTQFGTNITELDTALTKLNDAKSAEKLATSLAQIEKQIRANNDALTLAEENDKTRKQELRNQLTLLEKQKELLKSINQESSLYNEILVSVGNTVKDSFTGAFMKLNDALIDGSITMGMVGDTFRDMVGNMLREIQKSVFKQSLADPIAGAITKSLPNIFGAVTGVGSAPTSLHAAGGPVHMAGGGLKRDRVPAMLEPGEFVMRKEAVKQAGIGTMMRMNAAPQQLQSGGQVMQGNATYSVARAMELEAMGLTASQARTVAQDEANKSKSVGGAFSYSNNKINSMKGAPSTSTPATPSNALKAVQDMLGIGKQSSLQTSGTTQTAGLFDFLDRGLSNKPSDVKKLQERFNGGNKSKSKPKSNEKGVIDTVLGYVGLASAAVMNDASSAYAQFVGGSGIAGSVNLKPLERDPKIMEALLGGTKVTGAPGSTASSAPITSDGRAAGSLSKAVQDATFDPTGNLADVLGADGFRGIPISIIGAMLGFDVPTIFARAPSTATPSQTKAKINVFQRTGQMPTGYKGSYKPGDVTNSGNLMRADETGVVSGIDPFALDRLGYSGNIATTMGGSKGFRASGSDVEFSSIRDFITANFEAPGRQSALTVAEYNSMSESGRSDYAPGLGGGRALSGTQASQLALSGAYYTPGRGLTIPSGGSFSGSLNKALSGPAGGGGSGGGFEFGTDEKGNFGGPSAGATGGFSIGGIDFSDDNFGLASGGLVRKMAAGGAVQSRDRVPALLEPGEFVMRRPAAKAIGGAALNQMNATGKNLTPPNIQVNLNNQGAPKNVQSAAPRIQGDKIIIDMITRDLRNNGPIKKSLRK
jgi:hypothetical protein